jgi:hypothetical protein
VKDRSGKNGTSGLKFPGGLLEPRTVQDEKPPFGRPDVNPPLVFRRRCCQFLRERLLEKKASFEIQAVQGVLLVNEIDVLSPQPREYVLGGFGIECPPDFLLSGIKTSHTAIVVSDENQVFRSLENRQCPSLQAQAAALFKGKNDPRRIRRNTRPKKGTRRTPQAQDDDQGPPDVHCVP